MPFLIEDLTPRAWRVPGGPAADHPNGATGIARLEVTAPDPDGAARKLAALTGTTPGPPALGACVLILAEGAGEPGPTAVGLSTAGPAGAGELDAGLAHGVRFTLAPEVDS